MGDVPLYTTTCTFWAASVLRVEGVKCITAAYIHCRQQYFDVHPLLSENVTYKTVKAFAFR